MEHILQHYGISPPAGEGWRKIRCPNKGSHAHGDRSASASVYLGKGKLKCYGCSLSGGPIEVLMIIEEIDRASAEAKYKIISGGSYCPVSSGSDERRRSPQLFDQGAAAFERGSGFFQDRRREKPGDWT